MNILADESLDGPIVEWLRSNHHDVVWAAEVFAGASDEQLVQQAIDQERIIITSDRDFGELVYRHGLRPPGLVLIRIRAASAASLLDAFATNWPTIEANINGKFVVVGRGRIRVRPLLRK